MRLRVLAGVALLSNTGCAATLHEHLAAGRFEEAWAATCGADAATPSRADALALEAQLDARTHLELVGDAIPGDEANARLGAPVLPDDAALVQFKVELIDAPGSYVAFEPRGLSAPQPMGAWHGHDLWALAGLDPGASPKVTFSTFGLLLDGTLAAATGGLSLFPDPNFRDVRITGESRPGDASPRQARALRLLTRLDQRASEDGRFIRDFDDSVGAVSTSECRATLDETCEWVVVLSPNRRRAEHHLEAPVSLPPPSPSSDALVFRWAFDHPSLEHCRWSRDTVAELPAGATLSDRVDALFAKGPIHIGAAHSVASPPL